MDLSNYDLNALHLLYKNISRIFETTEAAIKDEYDITSVNFKDLKEQLLYYSTLLELIRTKISECQTGNLLFSVEDMFRIVGQFDKYVIVYFYLTSAAYQSYGEELHGHILYGRKSRRLLTETICKEIHTQSDGIIIFDTIDIDKQKIL